LPSRINGLAGNFDRATDSESVADWEMAVTEIPVQFRLGIAGFDCLEAAGFVAKRRKTILKFEV
jgi:hypothetical protein